MLTLWYSLFIWARTSISFAGNDFFLRLLRLFAAKLIAPHAAS